MGERFAEFWTKLFETAGMTIRGSITPASGSGSGYYNPDSPVAPEDMIYAEGGSLYPYVSCVTLYEKEKETVVPTEMNLNPKAFAVILSSGTCRFQPDSPIELADENQFIQTIQKIQPALEEYLNQTNDAVYVVGSIARTDVNEGEHNDDGLPEDEQISTGRAKTIANRLVEKYNVPADRIKIIGAGTNIFPWRNADEFPNGVWSNANAEKNRVVVILGENATDQIQKLKEKKLI